MSAPKATLLAPIVVDKLMLPVPSNETPLAVTSTVREISLPVSKAVAVAALPVHDPDDPLAFPVTLLLAFFDLYLSSRTIGNAFADLTKNSLESIDVLFLGK